MLRRDLYLIQGSVDGGEEDDLVSVEKTKSRKIDWCDQLTHARMKQRRLVGSVPAGRNPLIVMAN